MIRLGKLINIVYSSFQIWVTDRFKETWTKLQRAYKATPTYAS